MNIVGHARATAHARGIARPRGIAAAICVLALGGAIAWPGAAGAQPSPGPESPPAEEEAELEVPEPIPGEEVCTLGDPRLVEISGLAATADSFVVVNDGQDFDELRPIFFLDGNCTVVDEQSFFPGQPRDPEDLELSGDGGTLWIGDTGDNAAGTGEGEPRLTVALWRVDLTGGDRTPVIHRFAYPDGQPRDAETLLLNGDGTPIIVTKSVGSAELFIPTELRPDNPPEDPVLLEPVGVFDPPDTGSDNRFGAPGRQVITGGSVAPDGTKVVLRTYADAFEFDVVDGDVVAAITDGQPRVTPLPGEPQGEAITYTPDGAQFLTVSEVPEDVGDFTPVVLRYNPTAPAPEEPAGEEAPAAPGSGGGGSSLFNSVQDIINLIAVVGVVGLLLVAAGVFGIVRARRRSRSAADGDGDGGDDDDDDGPASGAASLGAVQAAGAPVRAGAPVTAAAPVAGRARPPGDPEPGWEPGQAARAQPAGVYTSRTAAGSGYGGAEYDESAYRGTEYGGAGAGPQSTAGPYGGREYGGSEPGGRDYSGREYGGAEYGGTDPGGREYGGNDYRGTEYGGGRRHHGNEYGGGGGGYAGYPAEQPPAAEPYAGGPPAAGEYGPGQPAPPAAGGYGGAEYGGGSRHAAGGYGGAEYGGGNGQAGYPAEQYPPGWQQQEAAGHGAATYAAVDNPQAYAEPPGAGTYRGDGVPRPAQPPAPDYYSDDPDYPYEFREPGRW